MLFVEREKERRLDGIQEIFESENASSTKERLFVFVIVILIIAFGEWKRKGGFVMERGGMMDQENDKI